MGQKVRGVIARAKGAPVELVAVQVPDPGPGEVLVRVLACGVCHTDLHYREGAISDEFPFLLGHEASGKVEAVGPTSPTWLRATSSSWPGGLRAGSAARACGAAPGTASTAATPARR